MTATPERDSGDASEAETSAPDEELYSALGKVVFNFALLGESTGLALRAALGDTVLVQLQRDVDPETGQRYTVKRYESEKATDGDSWRHTKITLKPINPAFEKIVITSGDEQQLQVVAEMVEVMTE